MSSIETFTATVSLVPRPFLMLVEYRTFGLSGSGIGKPRS